MFQMSDKPIKSALISVYYKTGLESIVRKLHNKGVLLYSTGGTQSFIEGLGIPVTAVEQITGFPSILDGRVKTLHPGVFGGILAIRNEDHLSQLNKYGLPSIDMVIVDLYPFEETVNSGGTNEEIIEKIDIGGISLIRAAAKNHNDVLIVPSVQDYAFVDAMLDKGNFSTLEERNYLASRAFQVSAHYDTAIGQYFRKTSPLKGFSCSIQQSTELRYGENPHQKARFHGDLTEIFETLAGKALSYNNLIDVEAAILCMQDFADDGPTFAILKHNNTCGIASRKSCEEAWDAALEADPVSAFGGILISNCPIDVATALKIDQLFYEVLIAPAFEQEAFDILSKKKNRILLKLKKYPELKQQFRSMFGGVIAQDHNTSLQGISDLTSVTTKEPTPDQLEDLVFANKCTKHLKSNAIALVKNKQLLDMGCGQTSRVDALKQAIHKASSFGLDIRGAVMSSEAFFPFPDCVNIAHEAGISAVVQPGGSVKDQDSIDYCNQVGMSMVFTGIRHFKH